MCISNLCSPAYSLPLNNKAGQVFLSYIHNDFIIMKEIRPACDPNGVYSVKRTCAELGISNKTLKNTEKTGISNRSILIMSAVRNTPASQ